MNAIQPEGISSAWSTNLTQPPAGPLATLGDLSLVTTSRSGGAEHSATLHALDLTDGGLRWQEPFKHVFISGLATASDDLLLVSLTSTDLLRGEGALVALDATGEERWRWAPGVQRVSTSALADDAACLTADAKALVVLDLASSEERTRVL